ncbi:MAG: restriction system protein [Verrucomicrobiota bacterium]|jgi:restriction system protein
MTRRSSLGRLIISMAREAARAQRRAEAENRRRIREQDRAGRAAVRSAAITTKQAKQRYIEQRVQETEELNLQLAEQLNELKSILANASYVAAGSIFEAMRLRTAYPAFSPPAHLATPQPPPIARAYLSKIKPLSKIARFFPRCVERHTLAIRAAEAVYESAVSAYSASEQTRTDEFLKEQAKYERELIAYNENVRERDNLVDGLLASYRNHDPEAVVTFCDLVLARSSYPEKFPHGHRLAFVPESKQLVVEYELPPPSIIPSVQEYRYNKSKDAIEERPTKNIDQKESYQDIVASVALRNLSEIFYADDAHSVQVLVFNGFIRTVDPATGQDVQPHLISVRVTVDRFREIDLERVDKLVCLRNLGAQVSPRPHDVQPIKPIVNFNMVDKRFVEQTDLLATLESRPNLMELTPTEFEQLVANLFAKMGIEAHLTRSHRDGGVDVIGVDNRPAIGGKVVIQAKRYKNAVGVSAVRDLYGTMQHEGANKGILVTTSHYGPDAWLFAEKKPIELIEGAGLLHFLDQYGTPARIVFPEDYVAPPG